MKATPAILPVLLAATAAIAWPTAARAQAPAGTVPAEATPPAPTAAAVEPFLGVVTERISDEVRHQLPMIKPGAGLIVREVMAHSPAALTNLAELDILLHWNDQMLVHPAQLQVLVASAKPGDQISLEFLHQGTLTTARVTLGARPQQPSAASPAPAGQPASPLSAMLTEALQNPEVMKQAAAALAQSGIDPAMLAGALEGLDLKQLNLEALAPEALRASKLVIITPDGKRQEITLADILKNGAGLDQILKQLDPGKTDPLALLGSRILVVKPDGSQQEISPAELLKNSDAILQLLQGVQSLQGQTQPGAP
jgi:hypothetical protein